MKKRRLTQFKGFTLIETIATIAIAGIIMIMILPYFQSGITESHKPAQWLQDAVALQRAMENMNGAYRGIPTKNNAAVQALSNSIGAVGSSFNNTFGVYTVLENSFISFNGAGNEQAGGTRILKVTIASPARAGFQLTQLFTVQ
jgi:prepilin-type N-terminal cleavage/methylation domain-containing protein